MDDDLSDGGTLSVTLGAEGGRLDKALARALADRPGLSRSRLAQLVADGAVSVDGRAVTDPAAKTPPGAAAKVALPPPVAAEPEPQAIPLAVIHEDAHLIVVDKPAGMVVHPAPGSPDGTLVNALLHHCGEGLRGIGGVARPGIVHRIDKDTSGLLVVAKTQAAHEGLAALFAAHDVERAYLAVTAGVPDPGDPRLAGLAAIAWEGPTLRIDAPLARHPHDRKRMAVAPPGRGKRAVTRLKVVEPFATRAALVECRLETGRTHQIRVHAAHVGHPLVGDPVYGAGRRTGLAFARQALHACTLGFVHPATGRTVLFESPTPEDMRSLITQLRYYGSGPR